MNYTKRARGKEFNRGFFSYLTEAVIDSLSIDEADNIYFDLNDIPGYGKGNMFEIVFLNNGDRCGEDIDKIPPKFNVDIYNLTGTLTEEIRILAEKRIKQHFKLNEKLIANAIPKKFDIGVHRRATDISIHHSIIPISKYFKEIDKFDRYKTIFLSCDNYSDILLFKNRYGDRVTVNEMTASQNNLPFFKN